MLALPGTMRVARSGARRLAADLSRRKLLRYAEPDVTLQKRSAFDSQPDGWARGAVVPTSLAPPPPRTGAAIAVVDDFVDSANPDVGPQTSYLNGPGAVLGGHGTEVASAAAGAANGTGVVGVFPGARILSYGTNLSCGDVAAGVVTAADAGASVINLSLGNPNPCFTLFVAVQLAYGEGSLVVAAGGNEFAQGNAVQFPAAFPHVLSVAAVDPSLQAAFFSNANLSIDLAAPGLDVPVAVPPAFDPDGVPDGVTLDTGTSFAAPIVAGAAAWLATARPSLRNGQIADVLRNSATDLGRRGYDPDTGFGLLNVPGALRARAPRVDPLEPNDDIPFIDGTAFARPDPYLWRGHGRLGLRASVDQVEDPVDVYRIRVPGRASFRIRLRPTFGDPDLTVFSSRARTIDSRRTIIARSRRGEGRTDAVALVNRGRRAARAYVMVNAAEDFQGNINASYRLRFLRLRGRR